MSDDEWGPVVVHDGLPRPELTGCVAHVTARNGRVEVGILRNCAAQPPGKHSPFVWASMPPWRQNMGDHIIQYRLRKPKGLQMLQALMTNLPVPARQPKMPAS